MIRRICLLTASAVVTACLMAAQTSGRISGTVIGEDGAVVDHVNVCTSVTTGNNTTINCRIPVDNAGHFQIENVKFGSYGIFAVNDEQGYSIQNQSPGLKNHGHCRESLAERYHSLTAEGRRLNWFDHGQSERKSN
jgi:hypothetical protein